MELHIEIPLYIRTVQLSKRRLKKYYEKNKTKKKIPLKYQTKEYSWLKIKGKELLVHTSTKEPVISNPLSYGTPKIISINGQAIYNGSVNEHTRNKIVSSIKKSISFYLNNIEPIDLKDYPISLKAEIHDTIRERHQLWDVDNRGWIYVKAFQDLLKSSGVIIEDCNLFINDSGGCKFIPVSSSEERKLIFILKSETDERVIKNVEYIKELENEFSRLLKSN